MKDVVANAGIDACKLSLAPLKSKERALEKACNDYSKREPGPAVSWLFDIVRGKVVCASGSEVVSLIDALKSNASVEVARIKNRCASPLFNGYRDLLVNIRIDRTHICELQVHLDAIIGATKSLDSHVTYEYFRSYFRGNSAAVKQRLGTLLALDIDNMSAEEKKGGMRAVVSRVIASPHTTQVMLMQLAILLGELGGHTALELEKQLLEARLSLAKQGGKGPEMVQAMNDLAKMLMSRGQLEEATALFSHCLDACERFAGTFHPSTLTALNNLGSVYFAQKKYANAEPLLREVAARYEKAAGSLHVRTLISKNNVAMMLKESGRMEDAKKSFLELLPCFEQVKGTVSAEVAAVLSNCANCAMEMGDLDEAVQFIDRSIDTFERSVGGSDSRSANARKDKGIILAKTGDFASAVSLVGDALGDFTQTLGKSHPVTMACSEILDALQRGEIPGSDGSKSGSSRPASKP